MKKRIISSIILASLTAIIVAHLAMAAPTTTILLRPQIPSLASAGNPCLTIGTTSTLGLLSTSTCGSGGGGSATTSILGALGPVFNFVASSTGNALSFASTTSGGSSTIQFLLDLSSYLKSALASLNGNTNAAQTLTGGAGISVISAAGNTTTTNTGVTSFTGQGCVTATNSTGTVALTVTCISGNQSITFVIAGDATGTASGATSITDSITVTGLNGKVLPANTTGTLQFIDNAWKINLATSSLGLYNASGTLTSYTGSLCGGSLFVTGVSATGTVLCGTPASGSTYTVITSGSGVTSTVASGGGNSTTTVTLSVVGDGIGVTSTASGGTQTFSLINQGVGDGSYYLTNTASDLASNNIASDTPQAALASTTVAALSNGTTSIQKWTTVANVPGVPFIPVGVIDVHLAAAQTAGTKPTQLYATVQEVSATGTVLGTIVTTPSSTTLTGSLAEYDLDNAITVPYTMASTASRIQVNVIANVSGALLAPTVQVYYGGTSADSRLEVPASTVDVTTFVPYTGAIKNVNIGTNTLTVGGLTITNFGGVLAANGGVIGTSTALTPITISSTGTIACATCLTGNQSITIIATGDATGTNSGTTSITHSLTVTGLNGKVLPSNATGTLQFVDNAWKINNVTSSLGLYNASGTITAYGGSSCSSGIVSGVSATGTAACTATSTVLSGYSTSTGANPTASVGTAAVNGTSNSYMRADGAPQINQGAAFAFSALGNTTSTANISAATLNVSTTAQITGTTTASGNVFIGGTLNVTSTATHQATSTFNAAVILTNVTSTFLATDSTGKIIATTTPSGGSTALGAFGGTGVDGALNLSGNATSSINLGAASIVIKNYTSISLTGTSSLSFSNPAANGTIIILKSQGACTLTSATTTMIDARKMGSDGGAGTGTGGSSAGAGAAGGSSPVNGGANVVGAGFTGNGTGATGNAYGVWILGPAITGGNGGLSGGTPAVGGTTPPFANAASQFVKLLIVPGSGGGGGQGGTTGAGGKGGRGGGSIWIECVGALNKTGNIDVSGENGGATTPHVGNGGGAGGGGSGDIVILYGTLTANSGTDVENGGSGEASTGNGALGGAGTELVAQNTEFPVGPTSGVTTVVNGGTGTSTAPTDSQILSASGTVPMWKTQVAGTGLTFTTSTTSSTYGLSIPVAITSGGTGTTTASAKGSVAVGFSATQLGYAAAGPDSSATSSNVLMSSSSAAAGVAFTNIPTSWEFLGSCIITSANASCANTTIPAREMLMVVVRITGYGGGDIASLRFNADTGNDYYSRYISSVSGGAALLNTAFNTTNFARLFATTTTQGRSAEIIISNSSTSEKIASVNGQTGSGAVATSPILQVGGMFGFATNTQITSVQLITAGGQTMTASSAVMIFGKNF